MAKINTNEIQLRFINELKKYAGNLSIADIMCDVLNLSADSAYRRIRGETVLGLDETILMCKHFNISPEILMERASNKVTFSYKSIAGPDFDLDNYLQSIIDDIEQSRQLDIRQLYFAAEDVPVFHHMDFDLLTPFKFFYWRKSILNDPALQGKKFELKHIGKRTLQLAQRISFLYNIIPATEIWTEETITSTLSQIVYYAEAGLFQNKKDAIGVCQDVRLLMQHLQHQAELGTKFLRSNKKPTILNNFNLYACEVQIGNNSILVVSETLKTSFLSFNTFNGLQTFNLNYCNENERWINNLIQKAMLISVVSEKQRLQFFRAVSKLIDAAQEKVERSF
ncbi:MAG: hypothetical protein IPO27_02170 [Bacteroidetes bacterium]|nr:hypothetical protein [Bacteroidota bacterium]